MKSDKQLLKDFLNRQTDSIIKEYGYDTLLAIEFEEWANIQKDIINKYPIMNYFDHMAFLEQMIRAFKAGYRIK